MPSIRADMNLTPLIDILLVLLVIFLTALPLTELASTSSHGRDAGGCQGPLEPIANDSVLADRLKCCLLSRHHHRRTGDVEYRVTNLERGQPARDLFTIPAGSHIADIPQPQ